MPTHPHQRTAALFALPALLALGAATCAAHSPHPTKKPAMTESAANKIAPAGMVAIPGGQFAMGSHDEMFADAQPIHNVTLHGFYLDRYLVTNAQFARFVHATGYVTVAEKKPDPKLFPGVPADKLVPGSVVFTPPAHPVPLDNPANWWCYVPGANWRHPEGPGSDIARRADHPVVHVCWDDAAAYAHWAGKRLPTEAEWERAARGGLVGKEFVWGDAPPHGKTLATMANTFQGSFPDKNTRDDGYTRTSPVGAFPANGYGLYDMSGNVWEWCADWYRPDYYAHSPKADPQGPADSVDPDEPGIPKRVQRGGSFLCTDDYCGRFRPGGRGKGDVLTGASNVGFRCAVSPGDASRVRQGL